MGSNPEIEKEEEKPRRKYRKKNSYIKYAIFPRHLNFANILFTSNNADVLHFCLFSETATISEEEEEAETNAGRYCAGIIFRIFFDGKY